MALKINFRNNSDLFAKIPGVFNDQVITPNSVIEDKTIQWDESSSDGTQNISLYSTEECNNTPLATLVVKWNSTGFYITKGSSPSGLSLNVDTKIADSVFSLEIVDDLENELCTFESYPSEPILNLSLDKN